VTRQAHLTVCTGASCNLLRIACSAPPWGLLTAIDMTEGKIRWQVPLGSMQILAACTSSRFPRIDQSRRPHRNGGGVVFIAGTTDSCIRGFDIETGKELWKAQLPLAQTHADDLPAGRNGKQYLVVAAGGHPKLPKRS